MSATNRGAKKIPSDHYRTPRSAWEPLYREIEWNRVLDLTDPCAGDGRLLENAWTHAVALHGTELEGLPLYHQSSHVRYGVDYLRPHGILRRQLGITNPPFSLADAVLVRMLEDFESVYMLQRVNWLGSQHRVSFWEQYLPELTHLLVLGNRPAFVHKCSQCDSQQHPEEGRDCRVCGAGNAMKRGTDATEYAWFCWDRAGLLDLPHGIGRLD